MDREMIIKPFEGSVSKRKRKGRGNASGKGGECGRGHKGQKARTGGGVRIGFEGGQTPISRRLPKIGRFFTKKRTVVVLQLSKIVAVFGSDGVVSLDALRLNKLVPRGQFAKVVFDGPFSDTLNIQFGDVPVSKAVTDACSVSK